ncbi:MAG: hypothetical protein Fur0018_22570 [Anaerolineales bacterium]
MSLAPEPKLFYELPLGPAVAVFLLLSALAHFYLSTAGYERYVENLKQGKNPIRFYEYALSSSLMIVLIGMLASIVPWVVIFLYFFGSVSGDAKPPAFVYAIIPTLFVFFNTFAVNMWLQYRRIGPWKDYLFGERMFIILSLVSKSVLAWMIFAGMLAPI